MKKEVFFTLLSKLFNLSAYKQKQAVQEPPDSHAQKNIWGASGRKAQMDSGTMMQIKPFARSPKPHK